MDTPLELSRRRALQLSCASSADLLAPPFLHAAEDELAPLNRFPRLVHNHYLQRVRAVEARGLERKTALSTKEEAEAYVQEVQERIRRSFAPFPKAKCPLNPRITGVLERDTYRIEKLIFQSRPRFYVTANLYIPKGREGKMPAVVGTCGHASTGKAAEAYQAFSQGLARMGYVVLIYDPIGQGERNQYLNEAHELVIKSSTHQHNMAGNQQLLVGEFLGTWRAWDGMRALDYLLTREEVDPHHLGVTGNSGGGTMTTWLCGVEPRWTMAAPACFVTTWRRNLENELPQDNEQCPPRSLAHLLDHDDYLAAMAPKPVIILAKEKDYFDARGSEEAYERLRHLYKLLGAEDNIRLYIGPTTHGYSQENREAMYGFFNEVTGVSDARTEPELTIEEVKDLWCTPDGEVNRINSRTVFDFTKARAEALQKKRQPLQGDALKEAVSTALRLPARDPNAAPDYRILRWRSGPKRKYPRGNYIHYAVDTEPPRMQAIVTMLIGERWYSRPPAAQSERAVLYVSHLSADEELRTDATIRQLLEDEPETSGMFACDPRGVGESLPRTTGMDPLGYYGPDYFYAAYANMLNRPYVGGKAFDVLRVIDWVVSLGHTKVHLVAQGWGAIPGAFAALLSDAVDRVTLKQGLTSYHDVAQTELYDWPLSSFVPGVLRRFDLPDVYKALAAKNLNHMEPIGGAS